MQQHLRSIDIPKAADDQLDIGLLFREMLCVAAKKLSEQMRHPLEHLGVLYEEILYTNSGTRNRLHAAIPDHISDLEKLRKVSSGKGQTLFVYKEVDKEEAARLQSHGYRFTSMKVAVDVISRSLQLPREDLMEHLTNMRDASSSESILEPGLHIGCFVVRANTDGGFDAVVQQLQPNLIPSVRLPMQSVTEDMKAVLHSLNGLTLGAVVQMLRIKASYYSDHENVFVEQLQSSVHALMDASTLR